MPHRRAVLAGLASAALSGCVAGYRDPPEAIARAHYKSGNPPTLTLYTMVRVMTGKGAHSALVIDGPERVVFDAAGSFKHPQAPQVNDLHYGFTEAMEAWFVDYHARETYYVRRQVRQVSPEAAAEALARAEARSAVMDGFCTYRVTEVLAGLPGFEDYPQTFFPDVASKAFGAYPGVVTQAFHDDSPDDRSDIGGLGGYQYIGQGTRMGEG